MKKHYAWGIILSLLFTYFVFRNVDIQSFIDALAKAHYLYVLPMVLSSLVGFFFRAWRWQYFLKPLKSIPLEGVWSATIIGYMGLNVLPARLGEFVRPYAIGILGGISKSSALATVVVERVLDVIFLLLFFVIVLLGVDIPDWFIKGSYVVVISLVILIGFLFFLFFQEKRALRWADGIFRFFPGKLAGTLKHIMESFIQGLHVCKATEHYAAIFLFSILMWLGYTLSIYFGFFVFDLVSQYNLTFFGALVVIVFTAVGLMIPAAMGGLGTFHLFCQMGLNAMGVPDGEAVGYAFLVHGVSFVLISILGIAYLWKENLHFSDVRKGETAP